MLLIGMLDSPYVRRVAISLQVLGLPFEHNPLSVFRNFEAFSAINPVVKAPTLVCDGGEVLLDSTLILDYAETLAGRSLLPRELEPRRRALRVIGLALAACEKSIQIIYERTLRPAEKQHAPWLERVSGQLHAAYAALEAEVALHPLGLARESIDQASISSAVAWLFTQNMASGEVLAASYPALAAHSAAAEQLAEFRAAAYGAGTYRAAPRA
jgi:glutathione S-transferase